jgi:putative hydrolase of the HAD superfamily
MALMHEEPGLRDGRPLRAAIFDFGGVMTQSPFVPPDDADPEMLRLGAFFLDRLRQVYHLPTGAHDLHLLEIGAITELEFFQRLCAAYAEAGNPLLDAEVARDMVWGRPLVACGAMVDAVAQVRAGGIRTALLTNIPREAEPMWRALIPVDDLFEVIIDSSVVRLRKPDPEIFRLTCSRLGVEPHDCLFVDDLACNVEAAAALGIETILCEDPVTVADAVVRRLLGHAAAAEAAAETSPQEA